MRAEDRGYSPYVKRKLVEAYIDEQGRATAWQVALIARCTKRNAYRILDELSDLLGLYKDGIEYVKLE